MNTVVVKYPAVSYCIAIARGAPPVEIVTEYAPLAALTEVPIGIELVASSAVTVTAGITDRLLSNDVCSNVSPRT